jgi:hypothetical protein
VNREALEQMRTVLKADTGPSTEIDLAKLNTRMAIETPSAEIDR